MKNTLRSKCSPSTIFDSFLFEYWSVSFAESFKWSGLLLRDERWFGESSRQFMDGCQIHE